MLLFLFLVHLNHLYIKIRQPPARDTHLGAADDFPGGRGPQQTDVFFAYCWMSKVLCVFKMHHDQRLAEPCFIYLVWCLIETFQGTTKDKNERMKDEGGASPPLNSRCIFWFPLAKIVAYSRGFQGHRWWKPEPCCHKLLKQKREAVPLPPCGFGFMYSIIPWYYDGLPGKFHEFQAESRMLWIRLDPGISDLVHEGCQPKHAPASCSGFKFDHVTHGKPWVILDMLSCPFLSQCYWKWQDPLNFLEMALQDGSANEESHDSPHCPWKS